ncbi:MAG: hypothetical protein MUE37_11135 [Bacteroidales bacterium]|jgi:hypothetical protein|nr:hypothetical protein [Bacteroidales bacterium]
MKKNAILTIVALVAAVLITGCSKPEEPNRFVYTVNEYPLVQGFIHNYGMPDGAAGYNFDATIHSSGVRYDRDRHEFRGAGHVVFFQMYSSSATELANGTYQFDSGGDGLPATLDVANFGMNLDFEDETGTVVTAVSGIVKVSGSEHSRVFDFECMTSTGEKITGHFSGWIPVFDMRDEGK